MKNVCTQQLCSFVDFLIHIFPRGFFFFFFCLFLDAQVNLRSVGRKRFAHLSESQDEIHVDANIPWGEDTLFTLEFRADEGGRYALHTCNNR